MKKKTVARLSRDTNYEEADDFSDYADGFVTDRTAL